MATNDKHFELTDEVKTLPDGTVLHRIRATRDSKWAKKGDLGGWVEKMNNLQDDAWVRDSAVVRGSADICTFGTFGSVGRTTTVHRDIEIGVRVNCGCFSGTIGEFCAKVRQTHGDSQFAREYLAIAEVIKVKFDHIINTPTDSNNDNDNH